MIAAPASGSGKTTVTLALLRALRRAGVSVNAAKVGPDFIDPAFQTFASGTECINLDPWAMSPALLHRLSGSTTGLLVVEAMMGLFDGSASGTGSPADLAALLGLPVVLVVDASRQSHSVAALVHGFHTFRDDTRLAGVILNRVASARHEAMLRDAMDDQSVPLLGVMPKDEKLVLPSRHLGLRQAREHEDIDRFMEHAAGVAEKNLDIDRLVSTARPLVSAGAAPSAILPPPGQRIAIAQDEAFAFSYAHMLNLWRAAGAEVTFFSPLADEAPDTRCDVVFLPGGYPELHAGRLAANLQFLAGLRRAAETKIIYGECGGFMVLGDVLIDGEGQAHKMAGLLPVETSFAEPVRHLGYRCGRFHDTSPVWPGLDVRGHEFHYARMVNSQSATPLLEQVSDARGTGMADMGLVQGRVAGSFMHIIAPEARDE